MSTEGYWGSWPDRVRRRHERTLRTRYLRLDGEPRQKKSDSRGRRPQIDFNTGAAQLAEMHQGIMTGPVALDVSFTVTAAQPPGIHKLAKRLLDVLGEAPSGNRTSNRSHLLYHDDSQVTLLYVHLWPPSTGKPTRSGFTDIQARPLRDVVADLELVAGLRDVPSRWGDDDQSPFLHPEIPDFDPEPAFDLSLTANPVQAQLWRDINTWSRLHSQAQVQEALLASTDAQIASLLCRGRGLIAGDLPWKVDPTGAGPHGRVADLDELLLAGRDLVLSAPIQVPLASLPRAHGEGELFLARIREQLEQWRARWPILAPVLVPLKVTFLVVPPPQGKDLDNIALEVLPLVHEILNPLPHPFARFPPLPADTQTPPEDVFSRPKTTLRSSVASYEVIKLQRVPTDPPGGFLHMALGSDAEAESSWARIARYVGRRMDSMSDLE